MLNNKVAVVTGGGRGIGRGITEKLLEAGARVLVAQRQALDEDLKANPQVAWVEADLAEREAPYAIARAAEKHFGGVDILINNAGFMFERSLDEMNEDDWDRMMAVNLRAPVFLAKALLPQLRVRGGSIVNIGSIEGIGANPWHTAYCGSKAGVHGFTRAMAVDLGRDGIRCNAIAPGWINSDLSTPISMPSPIRRRPAPACSSCIPLGVPVNRRTSATSLYSWRAMPRPSSPAR
ncbi:3-phenylpropionate-dihydrodiol/cinnamic acid-dihydrodiol dehydrogenase [compost metagenome]